MILTMTVHGMPSGGSEMSKFVRFSAHRSYASFLGSRSSRMNTAGATSDRMASKNSLRAGLRVVARGLNRWFDTPKQKMPAWANGGLKMAM
jgi:hypothetical protein